MKHSKESIDKYRFSRLLLHEDGGLVEVRALGAIGENRAWEGYSTGIVYGYFDNDRNLYKSVRMMDIFKASYTGIYATLNPIKSRFSSRAENHLKALEKGEKLTANKDISTLSWLFIDVDRAESSKDSATNEELEACLKVRDKIAKFMQRNGWPEPIKEMSGNGGHLLFKLPDLENNKDNVATIKNILAFLGDEFDTDRVKVDRVTHNPARLAKFSGTMVRKGKASRKRPHRFSRIDSMPEHVKPISEKLLSDFISAHVSFPDQKTSKRVPNNQQIKQISVETFCQEKGLVIKEVKKEFERTLFILNQCLFNPEHRKKDACFIQSNTGQISYYCFHDSCRDKKWADVKRKYGEPEGYDPWFTYRDGKEKFNPSFLADYVQKEFYIINAPDSYHRYVGGVWIEIDNDYPASIIDKILAERSTNHRIRDVNGILKVRNKKDANEFNTQGNLINCKNGMLDINTFELMPHDPEYYSSIQMPVSYNPHAKCPRFKQFLRELRFSKAEIRSLQQCLGVALSAEIKLEKAIFLYGDGANGKSVFIDAISQIFDDNVRSSLSLEQMTERNLVHLLKDKLINLCSETKAGFKISDGVFKLIVTGDETAADVKYREPITFRNTVTLVLAANNLPKFSDRTHALERRLIIFHFRRRFEEKDSDKFLSKKLAKEKDGIFLWMLHGLKTVIKNKNKVYVPESLKKKVVEYMHDNDPVAQFVNECCNVGDVNDWVSSNEIYQAYRDFCEEYGYRAFGHSNFSRELMRACPEIKNYQKRINGKVTRGFEMISLE